MNRGPAASCRCGGPFDPAVLGRSGQARPGPVRHARTGRWAQTQWASSRMRQSASFVRNQSITLSRGGSFDRAKSIVNGTDRLRRFENRCVPRHSRSGNCVTSDRSVAASAGESLDRGGMPYRSSLGRAGSMPRALRSEPGRSKALACPNRRHSLSRNEWGDA